VFRLMRDVHLGLGILCVAMALVFALSSLVIIYRPWLPDGKAESQREIEVAAEAASTPRSLALLLMREHGLRGEMRPVEREGDSYRFRIVRPGTHAEVEYEPGRGTAKIRTTRYGALEMLVQLHVYHGFWHEFFPAQAWAAISLFASIGLLLLGVTGIYLWFARNEGRLLGSALLLLGLAWGLTTLALTRLTG
jgi:hypothetical protein